MRHYERRRFRHLQDSERYRDVDYLGDDAWIGPNEALPHGFTTADEPPWWTTGPWERQAFGAQRAYDEDRGQGREYGHDLGLGYGRDYDLDRGPERTRDDPYDRRLATAGAREWRSPRYVRLPFAGLPRRPDAAIYGEIRDRLAEHAGPDADDIRVEVRDGDVTLHGIVADLRLRYLAQDVADDVEGVGAVRNRLATRAIEDTRIGGSQQWTRRASSSIGGSRR